MNGKKTPVARNTEAPKPAGEVQHLKKLLQTRDMAWLRVLRDAQAKEQCRQL